MSDKTDRKLQDVVVARYSWRHEAEFAAGFLKDAGIAHRLQSDDPGLGVPLGATATIWVRGMDEAKARDVLDINDSHTPRLSSPTRSPSHPAPPPAHKSVGGRSSRDYGHLVPGRDGAGASALSGRERVLSVLGGIGLAGLGRVVFVDGGPVALQTGLAVLVALLILVGLLGHAPGPLRGLLRALAGRAP